MESLLYSETFFFISSICLVFVTLLFIVFSIYVINIARILYDIMKIVKKKTNEVSLKLDSIEEHIEDSKVIHWLSFLFSKKKTSTKKKSSDAR